MPGFAPSGGYSEKNKMVTVHLAAHSHAAQSLVGEDGQFASKQATEHHDSRYL